MTVDSPLITFFILAYAISWLVFTPIIVWDAPIQLIAVASFGPSVAAVITHRLATGSVRAFRISSAWRWTLLSTGIGVALVVLGYVVLPALVLAAHPSTLNWSILTSLGVYNYSTLLGGPLGEEPGWRGYALPRLEARSGPVRAGLFLGLLWAGWHLPLFLLAGWESLPLWSYALVVMGLSVMMTYGANMGRFSIITAFAMHAMFNTTSRFLNGLFSGTAPRTSLPFAIVFPMSGMSVAIALIVITRGRLAYHEERQLQ